MLEAAGFTRLSEQAAWNIVPGGRYFVTRNRSAVVAFAVPENGLTHCQIVASHGDSPTFKLKAHAEGEAADAYIRLNVERYGGMIMSTWFDKPLSIAGRALVRENGRLTTKLVDLERDAALIPNMPIHFNRDINNGYSYNPQVDMLPLFGDKDAKGALGAEIAAKAGVPEADVVARDLFLYNRTPASVWGAHEEFFSCPRIDDLECAATTLLGFLDASGETDSACAPVWAMFDNEEVGSSSSYLRDVLDRILEAVPHSAQASHRAMANSFMLSADNAHATHPNFPQKSDPCAPVRLGGGVVLKYNASQKYTTNAVSGAIFRAICRKAGVPVQVFTNRADEAGGSTLGNLQSHTLPIPMADIGCAQFAMHSAVETASVADAEAMTKAVAAFYRVHLRALGDGTYTLE